MKDVEKSNHGILSDGDRVWNMYETSISCEFEKEPKYLALHKLIMVGSLHHRVSTQDIRKSLQVTGLFPRELGLFEDIQEYQ